MSRPLQDRRALVTGGSRGIRAAIVHRLARDGAHVAFTHVGKVEQAEATAMASRAAGVTVIPIKADSADAVALTGAVGRAAEELGGLDVVVHNAVNPAHGEFAETLKKLMALPRYAAPDEIAGMVAYLAGAEAGLVTGASLTIDGGFSA